MAEITAQQVKSLRDKTGAGMADCKKALVEANGNMDEAIDFLRKKGAAAVAKRADKETNEGMVAAIANEDGTKAILLEVTCETDFVARNAEFVDFVNTLGNLYLNNNVNSAEEIFALSTGDKTAQDYYNDILAKFSERIEIGRLAKISTEGYVATYIHGGAKLAVLVEVNVKADSDASKATVKDIAMQVAAMNPMFLDRSSVDNSTLDKEKEIYIQQAIEEGKKADIAEKVAIGRVEKFYKEQCLVEQVFVKDSSKTIKEVAAAIGAGAVVSNFVRFSIG